MLGGCHEGRVSNLQVKNIPVALHRKIRAFAKRRGKTVRDLVLDVLKRTIEQEEFRQHLRTRTPVELVRPAADVLEEARDERDAERGR